MGSTSEAELFGRLHGVCPPVLQRLPLGRPVPALLEAIDEESGIDARLILTALVVDGNTGIPSEGFFRLAERRNLLDPSDTPPPGQAGRRELSPAQRRFWEDQKRGVFAILQAP